MLILCTLCQTYMPVKASQKLGRGHKLLVYEIDHRCIQPNTKVQGANALPMDYHDFSSALQLIGIKPMYQYISPNFHFVNFKVIINCTNKIMIYTILNINRISNYYFSLLSSFPRFSLPPSLPEQTKTYYVKILSWINYNIPIVHGPSINAPVISPNFRRRVFRWLL